MESFCDVCEYFYDSWQFKVSKQCVSRSTWWKSVKLDFWGSLSSPSKMRNWDTYFKMKSRNLICRLFTVLLQSATICWHSFPSHCPFSELFKWLMWIDLRRIDRNFWNFWKKYSPTIVFNEPFFLMFHLITTSEQIYSTEAEKVSNEVTYKLMTDIFTCMNFW